MKEKKRPKIKGEIVGRLKAIGEPFYTSLESAIKQWLVVCECICGNITVNRVHDIRRGKSLSCGCLRREITSARASTHKLKKHPLYQVWKGIKQRCCNRNSERFNDYGGRGISLCDEWTNNPQAFIEWSLANGYKQGLQIDRIDNDRGYSPDNCRFVTAQINCNNTRRNRMITFNGKTMSVTAWAREIGMPPQTLFSRLDRSKWTIEKALTFS